MCNSCHMYRKDQHYSMQQKFSGFTDTELQSSVVIVLRKDHVSHIDCNQTFDTTQQ